MEEEASKRRQLLTKVVEATSDDERMVLLQWAQGLQEIRGNSVSKLRKSKQALKLTIESKVAIAAAKIFVREAKRLSWDERRWQGRGTLLGAAVAVAVFSGQGAGIAALGGAVGVPLWFVLGAGGNLLGSLVDALQSRPPADSELKTTYTVIDAEKQDDDRF